MKHFNYLLLKIVCFTTILFILLLTACQQQTGEEVGERGWRVAEDGVILRASSGLMKLQVCADNIIRVLFSPNETFPKRKSLSVVNRFLGPVDWRVEESGVDVVIITRSLLVTINRETGAVSFHDLSGNVLLREPAGGGRTMTPANVVGEDTYHAGQEFVWNDGYLRSSQY